MIIGRRTFEAVFAEVIDKIIRLETSLSPKVESLITGQSIEATRHAEQLAQLLAAINALNMRIENLAATIRVQHNQGIARFDDLATRLNDTTLAERVDALGTQLKAQVDSMIVQLSDRLTNDFANLAQTIQHLGTAVSDGSAQIAARFDNNLGDLTNFTQRLDQDLTSGFAQLSDRLTADLGNVVEFTQRLDRDVAGGFSQIAARLDNDLGNLADFTRRVDQDLVGGLAQMSDRAAGDFGNLKQIIQHLDSAVTEGSVQIAARFDNNLGDLTNFTQRLDRDLTSGFAQLSDRLTTDLGNLVEFTQRLDRDVAGGFSQIAARLDNDLGNLADFTRRVDQDLVGGLAQMSDRAAGDFGNLKQIIQHLDSAVTEGSVQIAARFDNNLGDLTNFTQRLDRDLTSGLAQLSDRLTVDLGHLVDFTQRLDSDVGRGFSEVAGRLENDLAQLTKRVHEVSGFMRLSSGTVSKLVLDQTDLADRLRDFHRRLQNGSSPALVVGSNDPPALLTANRPPLCPLSEVAIPAELHAAIGEEGWDVEHLRCLPIIQAEAADALPSLLDAMRAARVRGDSPRPLAWALPPALSALLSIEESSQIFGVLGQAERARVVATPEGAWRLILGHSRPEAFSLALRWSLSALEQFYFRLKPLFEEALSWFGLYQAFHAIDIPDQPDALDDWKASVSELVPLLAQKEGAVFGIVLPQNFSDLPALTAEATAFLRAALREAGSEPPLTFQWVRGDVPLTLSRKIIEFAENLKISMDCTAVLRGSADGWFEAYEGLVPYQPLNFDLRLPSFGDLRSGIFVMPRHSGREFVLTRVDSEAASNLGSLIDDEFDRSLRRLAPVLDRKGREQFEAQVNFDKTLMSLWPEYFVFNWPEPPAARLHLFEFDAAELVSSVSPLARLRRIGSLSSDDSLYVTAARFLDIAQSVALRAPPTHLERRAKQVEEHAYLSERTHLTADAEFLTSWMPRSLGETLELGSGYGAMARAVCSRASTYVGLDLTPVQAQLLGEMDASGLVGDMQQLPFADSSFDTVIADNVVEHSQDPIGALTEACRVLRPGGSAFLIIPHDYFTSKFQNVSHLWKADEASVRLALESTEFVVARQQTVRLGELGVTGAYPSCGGMTGLWHLLKGVRRPSTVARVNRHHRRR